MSEANLAEVFALAKRATPGPWETDAMYVVGQVPKGRPRGEVIGCMEPSRSSIPGHDRQQDETNAAFIVASVNALPAIEEMVRELKYLAGRLELFSKASRIYHEKCKKYGNEVLAAKWGERAETEEFHAGELRAILDKVGVKA